MKQKPKNQLLSQNIISLYSSVYYFFTPYAHSCVFFFLPILLVNKPRGGGNHILDFLLLHAFFPFFSTEQMSRTSLSLLTKAVFFCWGKDAPKEIFLRALGQNFFSCTH